MDKEIIIQQEVKNGLAEYGLNEEERKDYENSILDYLKDKTFEKEEDLVEDVKNRVSLFVPSVRLLQKSRTKLQQDNAKLLKDFEDYKKNNPIKKDEPKKQEEDDDENEKTPSWAKSLIDKINTLEKQAEEEKLQKIMSAKREAVLEKEKAKYNKSFHSTLEIIAKGIDFSADNAETILKEQIAEIIKDNPAFLVKGGGKLKEESSDLKALTDALLKQAEADNKKAEALKSKFK